MRGIAQQANTLFDAQPAVIAAAHELKSPLTVISYIAQMLADESLGLSDSERAAQVRRLQLVSQRTLRLVQHLTVSYRLSQDSQLAFSFNLEPINMREVCEQALHELTPYAREYGQALELHASRHCPHLAVANREVAYDIVINLVDNAIRHNPPKGRVVVRPQCQSNHVRLYVSDNGIPIQEADLARMRRILGREPQPLKGHAGTSGLGLFIVGQLAQAMGGTLGMGRAKTGMTFFVDLMRSRQLSLW